MIDHKARVIISQLSEAVRNALAGKADKSDIPAIPTALPNPKATKGYCGRRMRIAFGGMQNVCSSHVSPKNALE